MPVCIKEKKGRERLHVSICDCNIELKEAARKRKDKEQITQFLLLYTTVHLFSIESLSDEKMCASSLCACKVNEKQFCRSLFTFGVVEGTVSNHPPATSAPQLSV
jgi:hypothetical protein